MSLMSPEDAARFARLESRLQQQETELKALRHEHESMRRAIHEAAAAYDALVADHNLLADDFLTSNKRLLGYLEDHRDEIKQLAVLAGNTANRVFPKLDDAFHEINRAIGLKEKPQG